MRRVRDDKYETPDEIRAALSGGWGWVDGREKSRDASKVRKATLGRNAGPCGTENETGNALCTHVTYATYVSATEKNARRRRNHLASGYHRSSSNSLNRAPSRLDGGPHVHRLIVEFLDPDREREREICGRERMAPRAERSNFPTRRRGTRENRARTEETRREKVGATVRAAPKTVPHYDYY